MNYLEIQYGRQIRRNTFLQFLALYLFVALHLTPAEGMYTSVFLSPMATMEEERNTYKYTATKGRLEYSVSGMK